MPERIQLRRTKGWRLPPNTVVVSRPSRLGNPFRIVPPGQNGRWRVEGPGLGALGVICGNRDGAQLVAVREFRAYAVRNGLDVEKLRAKNVACWCGILDPCHGDVILELANG